MHLLMLCRMKERLSKYRKMYQERYQQFIERIEKDAEEVRSTYMIYMSMSLTTNP